ncbi:MAG: hypothetical protein ACXWNJ_14050 [Vulcanimicrobiaceae bacterium]
MQRSRALLLYLAMSIPFGIAVHVGAEFAGLGRAADDLALSPLHAYLLVLGLVSFAAFLIAGGFFASRAERRRRIALLAHALPFGGRGPRFIVLSTVVQFAFFALTQVGEGCPLCGGDAAVGVIAAVVASVLGACLLAALRTRIARIVETICYAIERNARCAPARRVSRISAISIAKPSERFALAIANRPPPARPY